MTDEQGESRVVLLRDADGHTYLLPWRVLEQARLSEDKARDLERAIEGDVTGFATPYFTGRLLTAADLQGEQSYGGWGTFAPGQWYTAVRLQQGRVQLDND